MSTYNEVDLFRKKTLENSILSEIKYIDDNILDNNMVKRKELLIELLNDNNEKSKTKVDSKQELDDMFAKIEKHIHMQPWNKLQKIIKIDKIKDYCKINNIDDEMCDNLLKMFNDGLLNKYIIYSQMEQCISEIKIVTKVGDKWIVNNSKKIR